MRAISHAAVTESTAEVRPLGLASREAAACRPFPHLAVLLEHVEYYRQASETVRGAPEPRPGNNPHPPTSGVQQLLRASEPSRSENSSSLPAKEERAGMFVAFPLP